MNAVFENFGFRLGAKFMATKSFLKDITIKNKKDCKKLLDAMEQAHNVKGQNVEFSRTYSVATPEEVRKMFGEQCKGIKL